MNHARRRRAFVARFRERRGVKFGEEKFAWPDPPVDTEPPPFFCKIYRAPPVYFPGEYCRGRGTPGMHTSFSAKRATKFRSRSLLSAQMRRFITERRRRRRAGAREAWSRNDRERVHLFFVLVNVLGPADPSGSVVLYGTEASRCISLVQLFSLYS